MWHALTVEEVLKKLNSRLEGLTDEEVKEKLEIYGLNEIGKKRKNIFVEFIKDELKNYFIWLFIFTFFLSLILGKDVEAKVLGMFLMIYILFDFFYKYRTEKSIESLKKLTTVEAVVIRNGKEMKIDSKYLVPGDIVVLKYGDKVPADIRIIDGRVEVDESILTGESKLVEKYNVTIKKDAKIYEMKNILFSGTYIVRGKCIGVVVATGNSTYLGKIYGMIEKKSREKTLLEEELERFAKIVTIITVASILIVIALALLFNIFDFYDALLYALSLGIAVIPEGLPTALVIIYSAVLNRLSKMNILVKHPPVVESLGAVDVIITDKTGTLTYNQLTLREFWYNGEFYSVTGKGFSKDGEVLKNGKRVKSEEIEEFLEACMNSIDTKVIFENNEIKIIGDNLEAAMIIFAMKMNYNKQYRVIKINEFNSVTKRMSVVVEKNNKRVIYVKGAPESVLSISKYIKINNKLENIENYKDTIIKYVEELASKGYKVLGIGYRENSDEEKDIIFLGLLAFEDPLREDSIEAIKFCKEAGIDVIIATGDHPKTTVYYAKKLSLGEEYLTSKDLEKFSDKELYFKLRKDIKVVARATPEDKYRLVNLFKKNGHVVGFIGDGINDSFAIYTSDVGITIKESSDITKDAARIILLDSRFKSFIDTIKEGRKVYYSLKIYIITLLSSTLGIFTSVLLAFFLYEQIFLSAFSILFLNILVETLFSVSVSYADVDEEFVKKRIERRILNRRTILGIIRNAIFIGLGSLIVALATYGNLYSIILFFVLSKIILIIYYQIKYKTRFLKNKGFIFAATFSLLILNLAFVPHFSELSGIKPPDDIFHLLIVFIVTIYLFIVKLVLYWIEKSQSVPELHH